MLRAFALIVIVGAAAGWFLTAPRSLPEGFLSEVTGDATRGALVFAAAGCSGCHAAPDSTADARLILAGGQRFATAFGTFLAPNISPDPVHGIGDWTDEDIVAAVMLGVSPEGAHYYPALPYTTYQNADAQDMADLVAYMRTLTPVATPSAAHEVGFPFNIRRSLGGWKLLFQRPGWVVEGDLSPEAERGRYLVEALGHCGECHTPRNALGGQQRSQWLAGGPNPDGEGRIPNITPGALTWSEAQIAEYLKSGFTPDFDTAGGSMAEVVRNMSQLPDEDRLAIAAYLKAVPAVAPAP